MSDERRPKGPVVPSNMVDIPNTESGQLKSLGKGDLQSKLLASDWSASQRRSANEVMNHQYSRGLEFVRGAKENATAKPMQAEVQSGGKDKQPAQTATLAKETQRSDNLRDIARGQNQQQTSERPMGVMTEKATSFVRNQKNHSATRDNSEQSAQTAQANPAQGQSRIKAFTEQVKGKVNDLAEKGKSVIDRVTGQRDNKEKSTGQERNQQKERGKEHGR